MARALGGFEEPVFGGCCVGNSFLCGEGFAGNYEESCLWVELLQGLSHVRPVNVGHKVNLWSNGKGLKGLGDHEGTEVGAADANVDDVGDCLAGVALPGARDHAGTEILHVVEDSIYSRHHILSVNLDGNIGSVPQGNMKNRPILREVDFLSFMWSRTAFTAG